MKKISLVVHQHDVICILVKKKKKHCKLHRGIYENKSENNEKNENKRYIKHMSVLTFCQLFGIITNICKLY